MNYGLIPTFLVDRLLEMHNNCHVGGISCSWLLPYTMRNIPKNIKNIQRFAYRAGPEPLRRYSTRDQDPLLGRGSTPNVQHIRLYTSTARIGAAWKFCLNAEKEKINIWKKIMQLHLYSMLDWKSQWWVLLKVTNNAAWPKLIVVLCGGEIIVESCRLW